MSKVERNRGQPIQQLGLSHFKLLLLKGEYLNGMKGKEKLIRRFVFLLLQHQLNLNISGKIMEN